MLRKVKQHLAWYGYRGLILALTSKMLPRSREVEVKPPKIPYPLFLRTRTSDISTYHHIFVDAGYEVELRKEPKVIIDGGSNIGLSAIYFANHYPQAKVIAVEPEIANFTLSLKNFKPYPNIIPIRAALWKNDTDIDLIDPGLGYWGFQTTEHITCSSDSFVGKVAGMTIDKIMMDHDIEFVDILKIDIEGAEREVFEDASKWIDKVGVIIIELHDRFKDGCRQSVYNAVSDFEFEYHRGEDDFFAKREYVPTRPLQQTWIPLSLPSRR